MASKAVAVFILGLLCSQGMVFAGPLAPTKMSEEAKALVKQIQGLLPQPTGLENKADLRKIAWGTCLENIVNFYLTLFEAHWLFAMLASIEEQLRIDLERCTRDLTGDQLAICKATAQKNYKQNWRDMYLAIGHLSVRGLHFLLSGATCIGIL